MRSPGLGFGAGEPLLTLDSRGGPCLTCMGCFTPRNLSSDMGSELQLQLLATAVLSTGDFELQPCRFATLNTTTNPPLQFRKTTCASLVFPLSCSWQLVLPRLPALGASTAAAFPSAIRRRLVRLSSRREFETGAHVLSGLPLLITTWDQFRSQCAPQDSSLPRPTRHHHHHPDGQGQ